MPRLPRRVTALLVCAVLAASGLGVSGCGAVGHAVGGIAAHHIADHLLGRRDAGRVFCLYHGHRLFVDLRHGSHLAAAINAYEALRSCREGFGHRAGPGR